MVDISFSESLSVEGEFDAIIVPFYADKGLVKLAADIGDLEKDIEFITGLGDFKAKSEEILSTYLFHRPQKRLVLFGLGPQEVLNLELFRRSFSKALGKVFSLNSKSAQVFIPTHSGLSSVKLVEASLETMFLMNYEFRGYKKSFEAKSLDRALFITKDQVDSGIYKQIEALIGGVNLTRDLVNKNADEVTPEYLRDIVKALPKECDNLKVSILDKKDLEKEDMGLFLSVARASQRDPYFVIMEYKNASNSDINPVIIGKGITYDTGGLSLKPTSGMIEMKSDMGGSAVVIGLLKAIATMKLPINVTGVCAFSENSIGSGSYKIGDVYVGKGKVSVEVTNTDAEGRLALADSISYSLEKLNPTHIIDIATLTGASEVALGSERASLFSNNNDFAKLIFSAGESTAEKVWEMPLDEEYKEILKSKIADIKNSGSRAGSLIASAIFLKEFISKDVTWAHLDIAGTTLLSAPRRYHRSQATGYGVRLLVQALKQLYKIS